MMEEAGQQREAYEDIGKETKKMEGRGGKKTEKGINVE